MGERNIETIDEQKFIETVAQPYKEAFLKFYNFYYWELPQELKNDPWVDSLMSEAGTISYDSPSVRMVRKLDDGRLEGRPIFEAVSVEAVHQMTELLAGIPENSLKQVEL